MRIAAVKITNWRSIKELSFTAGRITALVGANNAGKTAILSALNFLLGSKWPMSQSLEDSDFYGRSRKAGMCIQVWFEPETDGLYSAWYQYAPEGEGETGARVQYKQDGQAYNLNNKTKDRFPLIYIDSERSYERQIGLSRYTLFGQAIRHLEAHFEEQVGHEAKNQLGLHLDAAPSYTTRSSRRSGTRSNSSFSIPAIQWKSASGPLTRCISTGLSSRF